MGGKKDEDKDLRKEVEMTEHTDSIEKVCQQYQTCGEKGLTDSAVEDVSPAIFSDVVSTGRLGLILVRRSVSDWSYSNNETQTLHVSWDNWQKPAQNYSVFKFVLRLVLIRLITRLD